MEKALQQPTREAIQQQADEATFARRALAVEKERAIAENELHNQIELARREEELIAPARRANERVNAQAEDERARGAGRSARPTTIDVVEARAGCAPSASARRSTPPCPPEVLRALALRELAGKLGKIEHLTVTPDLLTPLLARRRR